MDLRNFSDGSPSFEGSSKKPSPIIAIIFFVLLAALGLFMGISGFFKENISLDDAFNNMETGKCVSGVPDYGANHPNFEYTHKIGFIPLLNEYYYLILSDDMQKGLLVRADKDFGDNFDSSDYTNISGTEIKGNVKSTSRKVQENFSGMDYRMVNNTCYIDLLSTKMNIRWLIIGIYNVLALVCAAVNIKKNGVGGSPSTALGKVIAAVLVIGAMYCTYLLVGMIVQI
ncbi:MAG: hypothetical protein K5898_15750 [Ruminococcus sp.]|uniref:hypothetical protein n=1 Tax=Ruminococcus sp. TaxID=41978 RepID=UPI0025FDD4FC|nr:hypothetical protein [Ruminococcus sp.]MCR4796593.1 hypothetical protein [Ruminococcus sp.]